MKSWVEWQGVKLGSALAPGVHGLLAEGVENGFGPGAHRVTTSERDGGGGAPGRVVPQSMSLDVGVQFLSSETMLAARASMAATGAAAPQMLRFVGFGYGPLERALWVRPTAFEPVGDQAASEGDSPYARLRWLAADPTIYSATPTILSSPASTSHSIPWTNPGTLDPLPGLGGRQWVTRMTATTRTTAPWIEFSGPGMATVRIVWFMVLEPGQTLRIDENRHSWKGSQPADGLARPVGSNAVDVLWPTFRPQRPTTMTWGADSGTFTTRTELRGTW